MSRNKVNISLSDSIIGSDFFNTLNLNIQNVCLNLMKNINLNIFNQYINSISIWYEYEQLGLVIIYKSDTLSKSDNLNIFNQIISTLSDHTFKILAYKNNPSESVLNYVIKNDFKINGYAISFNSFRQTNSEVSKLANQMLSAELNKTNDTNNNFFGLGGESGLIFWQNKSKILNYYLITDSENIYSDFKTNGLESSKTDLVNYDILDDKYWLNPKYKDWILFVNISKTGLKHMAQYVRIFKKIVYVGCDKKTIELDTNNLSKYYVLKKNIQITPNNFILVFYSKSDLS
jgi:hypothetical protein